MWCCSYLTDYALVSYLLGDRIAMIKLQQATIGYSNTPLCQPLHGHFASGSLTAVIGVNGAGKSTLLKTLAGLQPLLAGSIIFNAGKAPRLAYLPQQAELDRQFPIAVSDLVAMGCWQQSGMFGGLNRGLAQQVADALDTVGMQHKAKALISELSGGQLQRVLFARLLVQQAPLILLDEPFTGIDSTTTKLLLQVIEQLHQQGRTLIAVLHDMPLVANHFPQALLLTPDSCHWGSSEQVLAHLPAINAAHSLAVAS
jgi:zinc/manganese transport system ATP-binding protein